MKKLLCICMAFMLIACPALAEAQDSVRALIDLLDAYLALNEQLFAISTDAYQCMEDFCEDLDYTSLVRLRVVSDQNQSEIDALTAPEMTLTDAQLLELMLRKVSTDTLEMEMWQLPGLIQGAYTDMLCVESEIDGMLLSGAELERAHAFVQAIRQSRELLMGYCCSLVNYLLIPLADDEQARAFWEDIPQRYPTLGSARADWEADSSVLVARFSEFDSEYAALISQSSALVGESRYNTDRLRKRILQGDPEALRTDALTIEGMPTMLPLPSDWLYPEDSAIFTPGESDGELPKIIVLWDPDVSLEAFDKYAQALLDLGATLYSIEGSDEEGWKYVLVCEQQVLILQWDPSGGADVSYDPACISLETDAYLLCRQ